MAPSSSETGVNPNVLSAGVPFRPTARGLLAIILVHYLIFGPVVSGFDVVATVLALSLGSVTLLMMISTALAALMMRQGFSVSIYPPSPAERATSGVSCDIGVQIPRARLLFGHRLNVFIQTLHARSPFPALAIGGDLGRGAQAMVSVTFPHRGIWNVCGAICECSDPFELFCFRWIERVDATIRICPPLGERSNVPIVSAAERVGDDLSDARTRAGDPLDLKPYDPSDGAHRLLWKVYAKTGELITRHPEAAMTPEGLVAVHACVGALDDTVCAAAARYCEKLEEHQLLVRFTCSGAVKEGFACSAESALDRMMISVWESDAALLRHAEQEALDLLASLRRELNDSTATRIVIFFSHGDTKRYAAALQFADTLARYGIEPLMVTVVQPAGGKAAPRSRLQRALLVAEPANNERPTDAANVLLNIAPRGWRLYTEPGVTLAQDETHV